MCGFRSGVTLPELLKIQMKKSVGQYDEDSVVAQAGPVPVNDNVSVTV